jgi:hypothetical protein
MQVKTLKKLHIKKDYQRKRNTMCIGPCTVIIVEEGNQLDARQYFIALVIGSTCFGHHYAHHQELATIPLITTWAV